MRIKPDKKYFVLYTGKKNQIISKILYGKELVDINPQKVVIVSKHDQQ
jgi:hypothetical protein